jgi:hypothetical protein
MAEPSISNCMDDNAANYDPEVSLDCSCGFAKPYSGPINNAIQMWDAIDSFFLFRDYYYEDTTGITGCDPNNACQQYPSYPSGPMLPINGGCLTRIVNFHVKKADGTIAYTSPIGASSKIDIITYLNSVGINPGGGTPWQYAIASSAIFNSTGQLAGGSIEIITELCTCFDGGQNLNISTSTPCCEYYHLWKICGAHGNFIPAFNSLTSTYLNLTGNLTNYNNISQLNSPETNREFMEYLQNVPGAPVGGFVIGDRIRLGAIGQVQNWWCLEYLGKSQYNSSHWDTVNSGTGTGLHWKSNNWWNTQPMLDGTANLIMDPDCLNCTNPQLFYSNYLRYEVCNGPHTGEIINIIRPWATDPVDEYTNQNLSTPSLWMFQMSTSLVISNFSCTTCTLQPSNLWVGNVLNINWNGLDLCLKFIGAGVNPEGNSSGSWVEGIGVGSDNFIRVEGTDPTQLINILDTCDICEQFLTGCTKICTDPTSPSYLSGAWPINACDCNGDTPGTLNPGWNSCCAPNPCDNRCNDPLAINYNPNATGCCGQGLGIGTPTGNNLNGNCGDSDNMVGNMSTAEFHQYISNQANNLTHVDIDTIQYENMDSVYFGIPIPPNGCVGPTGGYMASFNLGDGYIPDISIAADINPSNSGQIYTTWNNLISQCISVGVTGVTSQTTFNELNILLTAWNPNGAGIPVSITPPVNIFCECAYNSYGQNFDCCQYKWSCSSEVPSFAQQWPTLESNAIQNNVIFEYNNKFGINVSDINPRPESVFKHINDTLYVFPGLAYLNVPLKYSNFRNLGLHFNSEDGSQGWKGGKQPKVSYVNNYPKEWAYAYYFMQALTTGEIDNGPIIDLTKAYYKVKTNMISLEKNFLNKKAKVITEPILGGNAETGLHYHIIPAGAIRIPKVFESVFPTVAGKNFKTWKSFIDELSNYGLSLDNTSWQIVSDWIINKVEEAPGLQSIAKNAAPEFVESTMQFMVKAASGCTCYIDPLGSYLNEDECQTAIVNPTDNSQNCCACIYGCTNPISTNYNPLATCDDGSCIECDSYIYRYCGGTNYWRGYLCNAIPCSTTLQNCANALTLWNAWGFTNFGDIVNVNYIDANNNNLGFTNINECIQWIDPNDPDYLTWLAASSNPLTAPAIIQPSHLVTSNPGLTSIITPFDNISNNSTCQTCGNTYGCTDPTALNYDINATIDDGSCIYCIYGCTDDNAANFNPNATCDDGSCEILNFHKWQKCDTPTEIAIVSPNSTFTDIAAQHWFWNHVGSPSIGTTINTFVGIEPVCYEYLGIDTSSPSTVLTPLPQLIDWVFGGNNNTSCETCLCIYGCMDSSYCNYNENATCSDGSCCNEVGCMNKEAFNYCPTCCCEGPCIKIIEGCIDVTANNYNPLANTPCKSCCNYTVYGCTDPTSVNYNPLANINQISATNLANPCIYLNQCKREIKKFGVDLTKKLDIECDFASDVYKEYTKQRYGLSNYCGSDLPDHLHEKQLCDWEDTKRPAYLSSEIIILAEYEYPITICGCTNPLALNYDATANVDDGTCIYEDSRYGCTDPTALNYDPTATINDGSCIYCVYGCNDPTATNYNANATCDDGSCIPYTYGCTDPTASNYNPTVNTSDNSCVWLGCTDPTASNYDATATVDDGTCIAVVNGCTDPTACNYDASATVDDGTCTNTTIGSVTTSICAGDSYTWPANGVTYTTAQSALTYVTGCNIATLNLTVNPLTIPTFNFFAAGLPNTFCSDFNAPTISTNGITGTWSPSVISSAAGTNTYTFTPDAGQCADTLTITITTIEQVYGCTLNTQTNYNPLATCDDGSCIPYTYGCTDPTASNYNPTVNTSDNSCVWLGCTDPTAFNYVPFPPSAYLPPYNGNFIVDDGTCTYSSCQLTGTNNNLIHIPDANFRSALEISTSTFPNGSITSSSWQDFNGSANPNGEYILYIDIANITQVSVDSQSIADLTGIECFTALTWLQCTNNLLTSLDVSQNTALTHLECGGNNLTSLDVSLNTALTTLGCGNNQLTSLDVSLNTALTTLYCYNNQLTSLDVSQNTALTSLGCAQNQLTSLDVSLNTALTTLYCYNNQLTSLDVSQNTALTFLECHSNQLTSLDVSLNTALTHLGCSGNQLTSLDVSLNTALTSLTCDGNPSMVTLNIANGNLLGCGIPNTPAYFNAIGMNTNIVITIDGGAVNSGNYAGCTDSTATFN